MNHRRMFSPPMLLLFGGTCGVILGSVVGAIAEPVNLPYILAGLVWTTACFSGMMMVAYHIFMIIRHLFVAHDSNITELNNIHKKDRDAYEEIYKWVIDKPDFGGGRI